ncbi:uncharacterized protein LOC119615063 [Lucilia sericata]|uniref:uncharacterized protein LOC119615063 n=1 Tax=Lucilia sericata TaxID=13632 RepID=UPI0018A87F79|nr:uncharacterized protein LOC119615063 [Lucilia sericata]
MVFKIISHFLIGTPLLITVFTIVDSAFWSCSENGIAVPVVGSQVAGVWYEIGRLPSSDVPACLEVIAPESEVNGTYTLQLDYINNVNNGWLPTKESLVFPWSEVKNGNFNLLYSDGIVNMTVKFKYLGSMRGYSVVCGYSDFASSMSIIRILSRNKLVNNTVKDEIDALANQLHISLSQLTWVQQDGKCNGTEKMSIFGIGLLLVLSLFQRIL